MLKFQLTTTSAAAVADTALDASRSVRTRLLRMASALVVSFGFAAIGAHAASAHAASAHSVVQERPGWGEYNGPLYDGPGRRVANYRGPILGYGGTSCIILTPAGYFDICKDDYQ